MIGLVLKPQVVLLTISDRNNYTARVVKESGLIMQQTNVTIIQFNELGIIRFTRFKHNRKYFELTDKGKNIQSILREVNPKIRNI